MRELQSYVYYIILLMHLFFSITLMLQLVNVELIYILLGSLIIIHSFILIIFCVNLKSVNIAVR